MFLEVVVVWTSLFFAIDFSQRFKLGRLEWNGETALNKVMGLSAILTKEKFPNASVLQRHLIHH